MPICGPTRLAIFTADREPARLVPVYDDDSDHKRILIRWRSPWVKMIDSVTVREALPHRPSGAEEHQVYVQDQFRTGEIIMRATERNGPVDVSMIS